MYIRTYIRVYRSIWKCMVKWYTADTGLCNKVLSKSGAQVVQTSVRSRGNQVYMSVHLGPLLLTLVWTTCVHLGPLLLRLVWTTCVHLGPLLLRLAWTTHVHLAPLLHHVITRCCWCIVDGSCSNFSWFPCFCLHGFLTYPIAFCLLDISLLSSWMETIWQGSRNAVLLVNIHCMFVFTDYSFHRWLSICKKKLWKFHIHMTLFFIHSSVYTPSPVPFTSHSVGIADVYVFWALV